MITSHVEGVNAPHIGPYSAIHRDLAGYIACRRSHYTEYGAGFPPNCEQPEPDTLGILGGSTLEECQSYYRAANFVFLKCESEALIKQRTTPHLLQQYDLKWLANVENRKQACMDLLASKGKLGWWDTISRWWNRE